MKFTFTTLSVLTLLVLSTSTAFAQGGKAAVATTTPVTLDDFTCGKNTGISLAEFKVKLVENCDLNKPFSASLSTVINDQNYFYCCQKKK